MADLEAKEENNEAITPEEEQTKEELEDEEQNGVGGESGIEPTPPEPEGDEIDPKLGGLTTPINSPYDVSNPYGGSAGMGPSAADRHIPPDKGEYTKDKLEKIYNNIFGK